jgi:hypothetical protein
MATRPPRTIESDMDDWRDPIDQPAVPAVTAPEPDPEPSPDASFIERLRASAGRQGLDRLKVKVFRRVKGSSDLEFCADYSPSEFEAGDLEALRDAWGPGSYELRVIGPRGIAMRESVTLARREAGPAQHPTSSPQLDALAQVLGQLAQGQARIVEALSTRPDPGAQLRETLTLMAAMREAMGLDRPQAPAADPTAMLGSIVGAVRQLREVSAELSPPQPAADADNPMALVPPILSLVQTAIERQGPPQPQAPAPMPQLTMPESLQPQAAPPAATDEDEPMQAIMLRAMLARITSMAQRNAAPEGAAGLVLEYAPDELIATLEAPDWWETLQAVAPMLAPHRAWVELVRQKVLEGLDDEPEGADKATPG